MPTEALPQDSSHFRLWREVQDMRLRTRLGGFFYLAAWLLCWVFSKQPDQMMGLGLSVSALFSLLLLARLNHRPPPDNDLAGLRRWRRVHWSLLLLTSLLWGLVAALTLLLPVLASTQLITMLATIAFSTAAVFNFPMQRLPAACILMTISVPVLWVMLQHANNYAGLLSSFIVFLLYLLLALKRNHLEYHQGVDLQLKLIEQREALDRLSRTDSLTQLGNRLEFNKLFPALIALARRQQQPLALLLDIDHFKQVNDRFGHMTGDECLRQFAERMRQVFRRDSDILLRLGGEEFGVLMPNTTLEQARSLGERFRQELERQGFCSNERAFNLTASLGLGMLDERDQLNAANFFSRVDHALYEAKQQGRNQLREAS